MDKFPHISEIKALPIEAQQEFYESLTPDQLVEFKYNWNSQAREKQLLERTGWSVSLILSGRGFGKSRMGSEWIRQKVERDGCKNLALIGPTTADVRDVMVLGPSGIMACCPPWNKPEYQVTRRRLYWPKYDAQATFISAEEPDQLRGFNLSCSWIDELAQCRGASEIYDQVLMTLRDTSAQTEPQLLITTTPRPIPIIRKIVNEHAKGNKMYHVVRGSTYENKENLANTYLDTIASTYEGTRFGRQELHGEILSDYPDAQWPAEVIESCRLKDSVDNLDVFLQQMVRIVVGVDPSGSDGTSGDETGIIIAGKSEDGKYYILGDSTVRSNPEGWARVVKEVFLNWNADKIVVEKNQGGDMVRSVMQNVFPDAPIKKVHAKHGKHIRAEGISSLYAQGKVFHIKEFKELEEQMSHMTTAKYMGSDSPDRLDAMVYALLELRDNKTSSLDNLIVKGRHH